MDLGLKGKKAIVTGATKGICRALVEILAAEGCDIAFCARSQDDVEATADTPEMVDRGCRRTRRLRHFRARRIGRRRHGGRKVLVQGF